MVYQHVWVSTTQVAGKKALASPDFIIKVTQGGQDFYYLTVAVLEYSRADIGKHVPATPARVRKQTAGVTAIENAFAGGTPVHAVLLPTRPPGNGGTETNP
jgi:hypothetical protein